MTGLVCMVTGANSGVGKATALQLARGGAHVAMVCRNRERGEPALHEIRAQSGSDTIELLTADFASQRQIRELADSFKRTHDRLDLLINNAGLFLSKRSETEDGVETTWAVNHLAPFLLTNLLLDLIKESAPSRIVTISSAAHKNISIDLDDVEMSEHYNWIQAYAQSKLANILFTYELALRLRGTGVTANCMHPGGVASRIWNRNNNPISVMMRLFKVFMINPRKSAEAVVRVATSPKLDGVTGKYFNKMKEARSSKVSYDEDVSRRLWQISTEMTKLTESTADTFTDTINATRRF